MARSKKAVPSPPPFEVPQLSPDATVRMLVIWWDIPEEVSFVRIIVDNKTADKIRSWHNIFINQADIPEDTLTEINDFFYDKEGRFKFTKEKEQLVGVVLDYVVLTGFFE